MRSIHKLLLSHIQAIKQKGGNMDPEIRDATVFLLQEIAEAYDVLALLVKHGKLRACLPTARAILESAITLQYIYKEDSERRAYNFLSFFSVGYLKKLDKFSKEDIAGHEEMFEGMRAIRDKRNPTGNKKNYWDGRDFREICISLNLESVYEEWYTRLSQFSHGQYKGRSDIEERRPYFDFLRRLVLRDLVVMILEGLLAINTKHDLLWGLIHIPDYPHENADFLFSINHRYDS